MRLIAKINIVVAGVFDNVPGDIGRRCCPIPLIVADLGGRNRLAGRVKSDNLIGPICGVIRDFVQWQAGDKLAEPDRAIGNVELRLLHHHHQFVQIVVQCFREQIAASLIIRAAGHRQVAVDCDDIAGSRPGSQGDVAA